VVISAAALIIAGSVNAKDTGWYLGAGVGQADYDSPISESEADAILASDGITGITSTDDTDTGCKLFGGYQINRHFAVELGYVNLDEIGLDTNITAPVAGSANASIEVDGFFSVRIRHSSHRR
jgi:OOP family OmpA-OmpF porin